MLSLSEIREKWDRIKVYINKVKKYLISVWANCGSNRLFWKHVGIEIILLGRILSDIAKLPEDAKKA